jgi:uncharacterized tellurite resistance protein B-like protein
MATMQIKDLDANERLALVALSRVVIKADGEVTAKEGEMNALIAHEMGEAVYKQAFAESIRRFTDRESLKALLSSISRREARELICDTIIEIATGDGLVPAEVDIVRWLDETWRESPAAEDLENL